MRWRSRVNAKILWVLEMAEKAETRNGKKKTRMAETKTAEVFSLDPNNPKGN